MGLNFNVARVRLQQQLEGQKPPAVEPPPEDIKGASATGEADDLDDVVLDPSETDDGAADVDGDAGSTPELPGADMIADVNKSILFNFQNSAGGLLRSGFTTEQINEYLELDDKEQYKVKDGVVDGNGEPITTIEQLKDFLGINAKNALKEEGFHNDVIAMFFETECTDGKKTEYKLNEPYTRYEITSNESGADEITFYTEEGYKVVVSADTAGNMTVNKMPHSELKLSDIEERLTSAVEKTFEDFGGDGGIQGVIQGGINPQPSLRIKNAFAESSMRSELSKYGLSMEECQEAGYIDFVEKDDGTYDCVVKEGVVDGNGEPITTLEELSAFLGGDELKELRDKGLGAKVIDVLFERVMVDGQYDYKLVGDYADYRIIEAKKINEEPTIELLDEKGNVVRKVFINDDGSFNIRMPDMHIYSMGLNNDYRRIDIYDRQGEVGAMTEADARAQYQLEDAVFDKYFEVVEENGTFYVDPKHPYMLSDIYENYQMSPEADGPAGIVNTYVLTDVNGSGSVIIKENLLGEPVVTYKDANGNEIDADGTLNTSAIDCWDIPGYSNNTKLHERGKGWEGSVDKMKDVATDILQTDVLKDQLKAQFKAVCAKAGIKYDEQKFNSMYQSSMNATFNTEDVITGRGARGLSRNGHAYCETRTLVDTFLAKFDNLIRSMLASNKEVLGEPI